MAARNYAVFILSYGRADNVLTYNTLRKQGYTGDIYIIVGDDDPEVDAYKERFGDNVIVFSKEDYLGKFDIADNGGTMKVVCFARNATWDIAEQLQLDYFIQFDDDYVNFCFRKEDGDMLLATPCSNLDKVFEATFDFLDASGAHTVCFTQNGDFRWGAGSGSFKKRVLRKAMNSFFCNTNKRFDFLGRINEDVTSPTYLGSKGMLFLSVVDVCITQVPTQKAKGGATDAYVDNGTYLKTFYSVLFHPSAIKCFYWAEDSGNPEPRIHHRISWNNCVPKILSDKWRKQDV